MMRFLLLIKNHSRSICKTIQRACAMRKKHEGNAVDHLQAKHIAYSKTFLTALYLRFKHYIFFKNTTLMGSPVAFVGGFNLLPYRGRRTLQQRYRYSAGILIASFLGVVIAIAMHYSVLRTLHLYTLQRTGFERTLKQLQPQITLSATLVKSLKEQEERAHLAHSLLQQISSFSKLLQALGEIEPQGIYLQNLHFQTHSSTLLGTARTQRALQDWVRHLKRIGPFPTVSIVQMQRLKPFPTRKPGISPSYAPVRPPLPDPSFSIHQGLPIKPPHNTNHAANDPNTFEFAFTVNLEPDLTILPKKT